MFLAIDAGDFVVTTEDGALGAIFIALEVRYETSVLSSVTSQAFVRGLNAS